MNFLFKNIKKLILVVKLSKILNFNFLKSIFYIRDIILNIIINHLEENNRKKLIIVMLINLNKKHLFTSIYKSKISSKPLIYFALIL